MTTSITTRAGKGSPLTHDEVDANFTNLQTTADAALPLAGGTLTGPVTMTGGTVTTSTPLIDATQTWNAAGVTFTGWKFNITNTASADGSKLFDLQYGGSTVMNLTYDASNSYKPVLIVTSAANTNKQLLIDPQNQVFAIQYSGSSRAIFNDYAVKFCNYAEGLNWSSSGTNCNSSRDTGLHRSAAGIVEINNGTTGTFRDLKLRNLLAGGGTVTTSTPLIDASQTWNASGVTFTGWKLNITNTASASGSLLADFQVGGVSKAQITVDGKFGAGKGYVYAQPQFFDSNYGAGSGFQIKSDRELTLYTYDTAVMGVSDGSTGVRIHGSISLGFVDGHAIANNPDVRLWRDAAATLALRNSTNAQTLRVYGTYTDSSNYVRASLSSSSTAVTLAAETAGTGADNIDVTFTPAGTGVVASGAPIKTQSTTVAGLMSAATAGSGARAFVTDATATTFLSTVAGGGANKVPVVSDGTNWLIG